MWRELRLTALTWFVARQSMVQVGFMLGSMVIETVTLQESLSLTY